MKRGGSRRTPQSLRKNKNFDENWTFKPLYESQSDDPKLSTQPSTSRSTSSQFISSSSNNKAHNNKNPKWVSKNHNLGAQFVKKADLGSFNLGPKQGEDDANKNDGNKGKDKIKDLNDLKIDNNSEDDFDDGDDVVKRLEKLRISSEEEPDLSEDLLINNDQLQQDEDCAVFIKLARSSMVDEGLLV